MNKWQENFVGVTIRSQKIVSLIAVIPYVVRNIPGKLKIDMQFDVEWVILGYMV